jgi:putative selenate reductase molybdopterin-binding subunit
MSVDRNAKVRVANGEIELGQGMLTIYTQIVAEVLGMPQEDIEIAPCVDSDTSPFGLGTSGSKVTTLGGNAVLLAAKDIRRQLLNYAAGRIGVKPAQLEIKDGKFYVKGSGEEMDSIRDVARDVVMTKQKGMPIIGRGGYEVPDYVAIPDETCYGNFSLGWTFSTAVVEVSVDIDTGKVDVLDVWHALDVGRVLNPGTAEGQIEGGAVQGIGYALTEDYLWEKGIVHNTNFTDYKLPVMEGIPRIHCLWVEKPNPGGPFGAKAMGEHSLNPIAPAIANAIYNAIGIRIKSLPITPEKILNALKKNNSLLEEA